MTNEDIINYVYSTPENSNPNVLRGMLSQLGGGGAVFTYPAYVAEFVASEETALDLPGSYDVSIRPYTGSSIGDVVGSITVGFREDYDTGDVLAEVAETDWDTDYAPQAFGRIIINYFSNFIDRVRVLLYDACTANVSFTRFF